MLIRYILLLLLGGGLVRADKVRSQTPAAIQTITFQPVFRGQKVELESPLPVGQGDSMALHTLRFYLSSFVFFKNGTPVFEEINSHHLLDLEEKNSMNLSFSISEKVDFDSIRFILGVDSLTQASGAMGGDLDPTRGMFWTWQSGYIHTKIEGYATRCPARNHAFQMHLGGYLSPFQVAQAVALKAPSSHAPLQINLDLAPFFEKINWPTKHSIMSPCQEAVALSRVLAQSFSAHAPE
jgi:hypothetical protein